jgi:hypothetical protein
MSLDAQRRGLEGLGFKIVEGGEDSIVATARKFHWDCMLTSMSYVVFVRRVAELTPAMIDGDREGLQQRAGQIDPSLLPRGLQKGTSVIVAYLADRVTPEARAVCESKPKVRFAYFYLPAARDGASGILHFLRETPMWGAIYFSKLRFLIQSVLAPGEGGGGWPVSIGGLVLTIFVFATLALNLVRIFGR